MTLKSILEEIDGILAATPYTRKEIIALWKKEEDEKYFEPNNLLALRAAFDYYQTHKIDKGFNWTKYQRELKELLKRYNSPTPPKSIEV